MLKKGLILHFSAAGYQERKVENTGAMNNKGAGFIPGVCNIRDTSLWPSSFLSLALSNGVLPSSSLKSGLAP